MKTEVFCGWGAGPDVGINYSRSEEEAKGWKDAHLNWYVDLTTAEARALAAKLIEKAEQAEALAASIRETGV